MWPILFSVVVISLSGVMLPGPMFAVTVTKSYKSPWAGFQTALGHAVIEVPLILLIYFGFARFFQSNVVQIALSMAGGGMIIWLGISLIRARKQIASGEQEVPYTAFVAGIVTSGLNPFFLLWWATVGSLLIMKFLDFGPMGLVIFIPVHWLCDLVWLSFVSVLVYKTRHLWDTRFQEGLFITCSLLLVGFGGWFIVAGLRLVV